MVALIPAIAGAALWTGCASPDRSAGDPGSTPEGTTSVQADLTNAPSSALCIRIVVTPTSGSAVTETFATSAGASTASLSLGALPVGNDSISANAYNVACASIGSTQPIYTADPATAAVHAGVVTTVALTFRPVNPVTASANFVADVTGLAAGGVSTLALTTGTTLAWGEAVNFGTAIPTTVPGSVNTFTTVAAGGQFACGIRADGTVWCWGNSFNGEVGPGVGVGNSSSVPVQVPLTGTFTMITAGNNHACAYRPGPGGAYGSQAVFCWGRNSEGQLGNGTTTQTSTPVQVSGVTGFNAPIRALVAGVFNTFALLGDGHFLAWGLNTSGQLGNGSSANVTTAQYVTTDSTAVAIDAGSAHTCTLHADGTVWCWGINFLGELGDGTGITRATPTKVVGLSGPATQIALGNDHSCALLSSGQVQCWGENDVGEVGDLSGANRLGPVAVNLNGDVATNLVAGSAHTCVTTQALGITCWGSNAFGQLGNGTFNDAFGPTKVMLQ
jgi:alpha-tubulin suppressor-like RCC1 family protein